MTPARRLGASLGLALAALVAAPEVAGASEPEPCVGFACLDEESSTALTVVAALTLGIVAGRGMFG